MDETETIDQSAEDEELTSVVRVREAKALLEDITAKHRKQSESGWFQRLINWLRGA